MKTVFKVFLMEIAYLAIFILGAAVEEMPAGYDQLMIPVIDNVPVLIVVLVLTIPVAILAMRIAERTLKKPAATLK